MVHIESTNFRGVPGLTFQDDDLKCVVLPSIGGKMTSLQRLSTGREFMWQDPVERLRVPPYGAPLPQYDIGGFQECFPTINEVFYPDYPWRGIVVPDHGEVWAMPWEYEEQPDGLHMWLYSVRFAYRLDKWMRLVGNSRLQIDYELRSLVPFDFKYIWSAHPAINLVPGMRMLLPAVTGVRTEASDNGRLGEMGMVHPWPVTVDSSGQQVDLSIIQTTAARTHDKLNTIGLSEGWCAIWDPASTEYLAYTFSLEEIPFVGVWIIQGGWPRDREGYLVGGFEACTGYPGPLDQAMSWGRCATLAGNTTKRWTLTVHIGSAAGEAALRRQIA